MSRPGFCIVVESPETGNAESRHRAAEIVRASGMHEIISSPSLTVLSSHPTAWFALMGGEQVLIIGEAFGRQLSSAPPVCRTTLDLVDAVHVAREMACAIWGAYIAVLPTPSGLTLFADPSGALPFAMIEGDGLKLATDALTPSLCRAIDHRPRIDWMSLVTTLVAPAAAIHLPHLVGLRPSVPGRLHHLDSRSPDAIIWSPTALARQADTCSSADIRTAVDRAVFGLTKTKTAVLLSGGFDSSVVLSSACRDGARIPCINYATSSAGGDERRYAAEVSARYASPLVTCEATRLPSYEPLFDCEPGAHPFAYGLDDAFEDAVTLAARQLGCDRLLTGQGGDAVFFQPPTPLVTIDRVRTRGWWRSGMSALLDDARRTRSSIWHHLWPAFTDQLRPTAVPDQRVAEQLLTAKARALIAGRLPRHPWLGDADDLPPGKRMHLVMLANSQIFHARRPDPRGLTLRHPLLTQPVLETVLPIPSYDLAVGSNDRGFARSIFADRLPETITHRRSKGDAADHYSRAALAALAFLREKLLDGILVREGLVDQSALSTVLTHEHLFYSLDYRALALHATCEAWARHWSLS